MTGPVPRLAAGHHLYPGGDGTWRCRLPDGTLVRVRASEQMMTRLQAVLHGPATTEEVCSDDEQRDALGRLIDAFGRQGLVTGSHGSTEDGDPARRPRVWLEGENPIGSMVEHLLGPRAEVTRGRLNASAVSGSDFVIAVGHWLPDAHWQLVDAWCGDLRVPFHRCHAEGTRYFVGPCSHLDLEATASYADTRARRLAAADDPDELEQFWRYLDSELPHPPVAWPAAGGAAVVAGTIVADVLAHCEGRSSPSGGDQLEIDTETMTVVHHPVLPIPSTRPIPSTCPDTRAAGRGHLPRG